MYSLATYWLNGSDIGICWYNIYWISDDIFAMRQKRAVELKVKVDRSDNMNDQELSDLRSEIKVGILVCF